MYILYDHFDLLSINTLTFFHFLHYETHLHLLLPFSFLLLLLFWGGYDVIGSLLAFHTKGQHKPSCHLMRLVWIVKRWLFFSILYSILVYLWLFRLISTFSCSIIFVFPIFCRMRERDDKSSSSFSLYLLALECYVNINVLWNHV